jgi:beta-lactamase class A
MDYQAIQSICNQLSDCEYVFYYSDSKISPVLLTNQPREHRFLTASVIKVPILYAWTLLERKGLVSSDAICDFADEPVVKGAGFSYLFRTRKLAYNDVLTMMIATSDNFCTNLIIQKLGMESINRIFKEDLQLKDTHLGRKMMNAPDRLHDRDNWTTAEDMIHYFDLFETFSKDEKEFISQKLLVCESSKLFLRNIPGDSLDFFHKSGGLSNVINEWGFTDDRKIFLLTNEMKDHKKVFECFGKLGEGLLI